MRILYTNVICRGFFIMRNIHSDNDLRGLAEDVEDSNTLPDHLREVSGPCLLELCPVVAFMILDAEAYLL